MKKVLKNENKSTEVKLLENKVIEEIESKIAESSEGVEHAQAEMKDYSKLSLEELVTVTTTPIA